MARVIFDASTIGSRILKIEWVNANANGDNSLIAAVAAKTLHIIQFSIFCEEAVDIYFKEEAGAAISETWKFADATGIVKGNNSVFAVPIVETATVNKGLFVFTSAITKDVGVSCVYYED